VTAIEVPGLLSAAEIAATADSIAAQQQPDGMILWFPGGHADPWNHIEAAMALALGGRLADAERAYQWLVDSQRADGSWHHYYVAGGIEDPKFDANVIAYVAAGAWHHYLVTGDRGFLESMWPVVERAVEWVLELQTRRGEILWARHPDGTPWPFALLTGSSSICHSLRCAVAVAGALGHERPDWELSVATLAHVIRHVPDAFEPKQRWAMDWYYPVLGGAVLGEAGRERLAEGWSTFVLEGKGVRCVSSNPWTTAAETCECVMAHLAVGEDAKAWDLFRWIQVLRDDDGAYFTGMVYPELVHFPGDERSTYTSAAVILAADALTGTSPASGLFVDHATLPALVDVGAPVDDLD
jgi:hypothetical protein